VALEKFANERFAAICSAADAIAPYPIMLL
jgi:hypothetical protein